MHERSGWLMRCVAVGILLAVSGCDGDGDHGGAPTATIPDTATAAPTVTPTPPPCDLPPPFCGGAFPLNTAMTTSYGPAWADVTLQQSDFLPCFGPYVLCYYANCTVAGNGTANCPCYEWFGPNFVDINAILNADVYQETVEQCPAGSDSCPLPNSAPVCRALNRRDFYPNATRVSTFSFYRPPDAGPIGLTDCSDQPGPYAGCMTAPCGGPQTMNPDGLVICDCPIFDGPYQFGMKDGSCDDTPGLAWSGAFNPNPPPDPCDMVRGGCVPDAPPDQCGCPLYTSTTMLPVDSGVDCDVVCDEYNGCLREDTEIQLGYTCDATLCTSSNNGLVLDACLGLERCDLSEIFKAERAANCSCCASQLCHCDANAATEEKIYALDASQRHLGETPQCDVNWTLCGTAP